MACSGDDCVYYGVVCGNSRDRRSDDDQKGERSGEGKGNIDSENPLIF